jgi:hypothetical protein
LEKEGYKPLTIRQADGCRCLNAVYSPSQLEYGPDQFPRNTPFDYLNRRAAELLFKQNHHTAHGFEGMMKDISLAADYGFGSAGIKKSPKISGRSRTRQFVLCSWIGCIPKSTETRHSIIASNLRY